MGVSGAQNCMAPLGSHCSRRTMDGSLLAPRMNSSSESFPAGKGTRLRHHPAPETAQRSPCTRPQPGGAPWGAQHPEPLHTRAVSHLISVRAAPSQSPGFNHETFP